LRLPAELRLEIYRLLLTGKTIHIEGVVSPIQNSPQGCPELSVVCNTCTADDVMHPLSHLTGASHSQNQSSATNHGTRRPCSSNHIFGISWCNDPVRLDVQLLRVCRQIYDEAMLLPYAENYFIISAGFYPTFREVFVAQFSLEKRSAMHTVAVLRSLDEEIELVPKLLPGLKRLWFDVLFDGHDPDLNLAASRSKRAEQYLKAGFSRLVGAKVRFHEFNARDEGMEERLELALLGKQAL
jgi:hypothetical protein